MDDSTAPMNHLAVEEQVAVNVNQMVNSTSDAHRVTSVSNKTRHRITKRRTRKAMYVFFLQD